MGYLPSYLHSYLHKGRRAQGDPRPRDSRAARHRPGNPAAGPGRRSVVPMRQIPMPAGVLIS